MQEMHAMQPLAIELIASTIKGAGMWDVGWREVGRGKREVE